MNVVVGFGLGVAAGLLAGWWLAGWSRRRGRGHAIPSQRPGRRQLLRWIEAAPLGWMLLDGEGVIRTINPRAVRLLQLPAAGLHRGEPLQALCRAPQLRSAIDSARSQQRLQRLEWQHGEEDLEVHVLPGDDGWVAVLLQTRRSLEAQLEQQERWVSDVAHELRTPLTALLLVGDSLASQVNSRHAVLVERLQRELLRLQQLVGDLLELSRLENALPGDPGRSDPVDLGALVEKVWAGLRPLAEQRRIQLALHRVPRQPPEPEGEDPAPTVVWGDGSRLHRALLNLLDNAIRYAPDGTAVQVELVSSGDWTLLSVRDHGPGLSEQDLTHLFERFYRGDPSRVRSKRTGSGLGLSIVQQIAVTQGGRVQARNHPEGGAVLELWLPERGTRRLERPFSAWPSGR